MASNRGSVLKRLVRWWRTPPFRWQDLTTGERHEFWTYEELMEFLYARAALGEQDVAWRLET